MGVRRRPTKRYDAIADMAEEMRELGKRHPGETDGILNTLFFVFIVGDSSFKSFWLFPIIWSRVQVPTHPPLRSLFSVVLSRSLSLAFPSSRHHCACFYPATERPSWNMKHNVLQPKCETLAQAGLPAPRRRDGAPPRRCRRRPATGWRIGSPTRRGPPRNGRWGRGWRCWQQQQQRPLCWGGGCEPASV